jgi:GTP-binding protein Era
MKAGYVLLLGKPNVGKSTLLNTILGRKHSIVSDKPQTTRSRILAAKTYEGAQIIFLDTPGVHMGRKKLNRIISHAAVEQVKEADVVLFMVDGSTGITDEDRLVAEFLTDKLKEEQVVLGVINKSDALAEDPEVLERQLRELVPAVKDVFLVSAAKGKNVPALLKAIVSYLPENDEPLFEEESVFAPDFKFLAAEIIREKVNMHLHQEVPHAVGVKVLDVRDGDADPNVLVVEAEIFVEKDSQKSIVIGSGGRMIKKIGSLAREELEFLTGRKVYLQLNVRVRKDWREDEDFIKYLGYGG